MRTALRTYHPVPSLQKTNGNLQDAPRIKNILKSCYLENESPGDLPTPTQVLTRSVSHPQHLARSLHLDHLLSSGQVKFHPQAL